MRANTARALLINAGYEMPVKIALLDDRCNVYVAAARAGPLSAQDKQDKKKRQAVNAARKRNKWHER